MIDINPIKNLHATVSIPGSKYIANRLLIICSLANGISILNNIPENEDINNAISVLQQFGVQIERSKDAITIIGTNGKLKRPKNEINVGDSGTLIRFIASFAALFKGKTRITGGRRIQQRPISDLLKSLNDLGIEYNSKNNHAPITIEGGNLKGGKTIINGSISSQFLSSLLLVSPYAKNDIEIIVKGNLVSPEYIDLTISLMKEFGVEVKKENDKIFKIKSNQKYKSKKFNIPSDWSSANYFLAAAAIVPGTVKINNLDFKQPESKFFRILEKMGCKVFVSDGSITLTGNEELNSINVDMSSMPDSVQTLAIVALFANGITKIKNIANLKYKESDRIKDTATELRKLGAKVKVNKDSIKIPKSILKPSIIDSHYDHRMAMSFALVGLKISGIKIKNSECINKSFPQFFDKLKDLGVEIKESKNIVLIGYRGAGKTTTAKELSKLIGMEVMSTDNEISKKVGMSLQTFISKSGWKKFRQIESEVIREIENIDGAIIDCGGGVVESSDNIKSLKKNGVIFCLKAPVNVLAERMRNTKNRPSITGKKSFIEEIEVVLSIRDPLYSQAADFEIETSNKKPVEVAKIILELNEDKLIKTKVCAVITAANVKGAIEDIKKAASADLIELRLDFIKDITVDGLKILIHKSTKPLIITLRPSKFGGLFKGNEKERLKLLKSAIESNVQFVDVEFESGIINGVIDNKKNSKIIVSHHNSKETYSLGRLNFLYQKIKKLNPDLVKIVTAANSINDNFRIFEFLRNKNDLIAFCMGQGGEISRILAPKFGSRIIYCSLDKLKESASGQITLTDMKNLYHVKLINKETNVIGIIGEFAENSMSKYMHNPNFVRNGLNFVYIPFKVAPNELKRFMKNFRKFDFKGAAVTIPHKEKIVKYINELDETAMKIGATNTLVNNNGKIIGYNADYYGAIHALREQTQVKDKKILVLGAGGAARAVVYGLKKEGAEITIVNRTKKKALKLTDEFKINFDKFNNIAKLIRKNDIIINTTSIGMSPNQDGSILDEKYLVKGKIVMDIVYKPINTNLIKLAKKKGCKTITGDRMLIYQAVKQFELWTELNPGFKNMELQLVKQISKGE